ncbi:hypothetical protein KBB49_02150 [Candidatus Saccharibacteria bacterium]|nr:hypothetical protein [Candidatus Saccharibacteria bacterium]
MQLILLGVVMLDVDSLRHKKDISILAIGAHLPILQSVLDFDYICGKSAPSLVGIVSTGSKVVKLFYGKKEVLIPCFKSPKDAANKLKSVDFMFNLNSGRRCYFSTIEFFDAFPDAIGGHTFAEDMPEIMALELKNKYVDNGKELIGPAGVGMIIPGHLKLGAIGGTDIRQIVSSNLMLEGNLAVLSASGGISNEIITIIAGAKKSVSFALCFGGDRFPYTDPATAFKMAQTDPNTKAIIYYGELGGTDEYLLVDMIKAGEITKPVIAYIAGVVGESFEQPIQFGHAKALANSQDETASAKIEALRGVGANVAGSIRDFVKLINDIESEEIMNDENDNFEDLKDRKSSMFTSTIGVENDGAYEFVGKSLSTWAQDGNFVRQIVSGILGREPKSEELVTLSNIIFLLSIDHGPQVSGALNTIVTARAGKNLVDSLVAGLLTVGPRFGGAVSGAAGVWLKGVSEGLSPKELVEDYASRKEYIMGIGHKKYRLGLPDPRTEQLMKFAEKIENTPHLDFAKQVEAITSSKKGNLILNIDGHIAALLLDVLMQYEGYTKEELAELVEIDFFNAFFVIPRTVGFISHYLDQKRLGEGLFRLPDDQVSSF